MHKILIVEDEVKLREELKKFLENNGYIVETIDEFTDTVNKILSLDANLILLDINLPNLNGEVICKEIRKKVSTPIIIVTSKNTEIDEIICFNYGADDFITKPYNTSILLARIERLLNRNENNSEKIVYKDLVLDMSTSSINISDKCIDLSKNEMKILVYLLKNKGKIISRDELIDYLWNTNDFIDDNTLTVNINRLRGKLESVGYKDIIITKRGLGYIIL